MAERFQISHFYWSFLSDIIAVKGLKLCQNVPNLICFVEPARRVCTEDKYLNFTLYTEEREEREDEHTTRSISSGPVVGVTDTLQ